MAYTLQAFVGDAEVLAPVAGNLPVVALPQGKVLIPLTEAIRAEHGEIPSLPLTDDEQVVEVPESLAAMCRALSARGRIAYLEAEFFGGAGAQAMVVAEVGKIIQGPEIREGAINSALRSLGVVRNDSFDEFEAMSLGKHRETSEWLNERAS